MQKCAHKPHAKTGGLGMTDLSILRGSRASSQRIQKDGCAAEDEQSWAEEIKERCLE